MSPIRKILIIQPGNLGNILLAIPLIKRLRKKYPHSEINLICQPNLGQFLIDLKLIDKSFDLIKSSRQTKTDSIKTALSINPDIVFCIASSVMTALLIFKQNPKISISYKYWWNRYFFTHRVPCPKHSDAIKQICLLNPLDSELKKLTECYLSDSKNLKYLSKKESFLSKQLIPHWANMSIKKELQNWLQENKTKDSTQSLKNNYILLCPGTSLHGKSDKDTRKWNKENFVSLGRSLVNKGYSVGLLGGPKEKDLCSEISKSILGSRNFSDLQILEALIVLKKSLLAVTLDTGSAHMAAGVELPVISLFGSTVISAGYQPWTSPMAIIQKPLQCRPCSFGGREFCPLQTNECMKQITSEDVIEYMDKILV